MESQCKRKSLGVDMINYKFGKYLGPTLSETIIAYNVFFQFNGATSEPYKHVRYQ